MASILEDNAANMRLALPQQQAGHAAACTGCADTDVAQLPSQSSAAAAMTPPAATILVVDDEPVNCRLVAALLELEGYVIECAESGAEALRMVAQRPPDLILLDIMMPGMDGYQVAATLKGQPATAHIPIIMLTALADKQARLAGLAAGAEELLTKPIERVELWLRVRNLLRLKSQSDLLLHHSETLEQQVSARSGELQRFRSAMDATADAILLIDRASMLFIEVNATACAMLGYARADLLRLGPADVSTLASDHLSTSYDALIAGIGRDELTELAVRHQDGGVIPVEVQRQAHQFDEKWMIVEVLRDIRDRKLAERRMHHMAHYDGLTGLPNRSLFYDTLSTTLAQATENGWQVAILLIDLDHFKAVNDTMGHAAGDALLMRVGERLLGCVRERDTLGRLGGDEFAVILVTREGQPRPDLVAAKLLEALRAPFTVQRQTVRISASIGIAVQPADAADADTLSRFADAAMQRAKLAGRDTFAFFTAKMNIAVLARLALEHDLQRALARDEFVLHYQPKIELASGRVTGVEALLRWNRPGHGLVAPHEFIPALEATGLIVEVGRWVIATACRQIRTWQHAFPHPLHVAVNVSAHQFVVGDLQADVGAALREYGIEPGLLELELTESALMDNTARTITTLRGLKNLGVRISIDDFGTGYSSLAYLRRFPIDTLKIDIAFIREVTSNPDDAAIARAIIGMAHNLRLDVVAEGVETAAQLAFLRRHQCDHVQGYYFSKPLPVGELETLVGAMATAADAAQAAARGKTLLLIDDDPDILELLGHVLRDEGYRILCAGSAAAGFELLALNEVQVIMCDQCMPGMGGTEFFDAVKDIYPETLRIALSGQTDLQSIMDAINRGAIYRFYTKPWTNAVLRDNLREAFRHHALLHPMAA